MEIKLKQLIKICNNNLKGCTKNESLDKYLPIKDDKIEIYLKDRILYIKSEILSILKTMYFLINFIKKIKIYDIIKDNKNI